MLKDNKIWVAKAGDKELSLIPRMSNRHGLIAGATGTGKTITLKVIAESFSDLGVPVFFSDVKGDLSGMCRPGTDSEDMQARIERFGIENWEYKAYPTCFWDLFGEKGHPVRVTISGLGPMLLSRLLSLTDVQEGVLNIVFKVADDQGLLLLDLKDLRAMLQFVGDNREEYTTMYGNVSTASIGAIQRALLTFEQEGGTDMFGEPALDVRDWIRTDANGRGIINILSSERLFQSPKTYGTFLLWMLSELYETLPEVGDLDKPRIVFFFDEAHVLFDDTPKVLHDKISQIIKLIRSKGVGVYFVTQIPSDVPSDVLGQLNNRVQHGLRAYTPAEQKGIKAAVESFRENPAFNTREALEALGTGEALISFLDEDGVPEMVESAKVLPPQSLMGAAPAEAIQQVINAGEFDLKYRESVDRESAYEIIMAAKAKLEEEAAEETQEETAVAEQEQAAPANMTEQFVAEKKSAKEKDSTSSKLGKTAAKAAKSAATNAASTVARGVSTNIVNSITGGKTTSAATLGKRAATNALSAVMRTGTSSLIRGIFGNLTK